MRRNLRLALVLLFLAVLYVLILVISFHNETSTLRYAAYTAPTSVPSGLYTDHSAFVPTSSKIRPGFNSRMKNAKIEKSRKNMDRFRSKPKATLDVKNHIRQNVQRRRKVKTRAKGGGDEKTPVVWRQAGKTHSAVKARSNAGSGQVLEHILTAPMYKKIHSSSGVSAPNPNHADREGMKTSSHAQVSSKANVLSMPSAQNDVRAKPRPIQVRNTSTDIQNGTGTASARKRGVRVIIVAHGRSGSSFFGGIFNAHPDFFFMYEPLNQLTKVVMQETDDYLYSADYVINAVLRCDFVEDDFFPLMTRQSHHRASSRPLVSPPFCKTTHERAINFDENRNWKLCKGNITALELNKLCRKHANIAAKILLERLAPADLSWILDVTDAVSSPSPKSITRQAESFENDPVHVLYLVRDPRAMIYSRYRFGWVVPRQRHKHALESGEADQNVRELCDTIEHNLGELLLHPQRIKLVRYEELATNPEATVKRLFSELHISLSADVFAWIYSKTHGPVKKHAFSLTRNANVSINAWRVKMDRRLLKIVETRCERVMKYLGYLPTNGDEAILQNMRKQLYLNNIRDLKESYQWSTAV